MKRTNSQSEQSSMMPYPQAASLEQVLARSAAVLSQYKDKHRGQRCVIIGNGPSLNKMDLSFLKNEFTFGMNRIYLGFEKFNFTPTYYVSVNPLVIEQSAEEILKIPCPRFLSHAGLKYFSDPSEVIFLKSLPGFDFSTDPRRGIFEVYTVTTVALQLAYFMGFKEVILIGVDHNFTSQGQPNQEVISQGDDVNHFAPNYFGKGVRWHLPDLHNSEIGYRLAKRTFELDGRRVVDATLDGKLAIFPKRDYRDVFFSSHHETTSEPAYARTEPSASYQVSAIVSTYNAGKFIRGCMQDLVDQTLFQKGQLEIVVVDSGSQQNEGDVVREYQDKYPHIQYIRTEQRESIYAAWNRAVQVARGQYITNANTDDRHHSRALEILSGSLNDYPVIDVVYADCALTQTENTTLERGPVTGRFRWPEFDRQLLFQVCIIGPQPMWRRSLHEKYGCFDSGFQSAGDYEFWLRISDKARFLHVPKLLGLYLESPASVEHTNPGRALFEAEQARQRYWKPEHGQRPRAAGCFLEHYTASPAPSSREGFPLVSVIIPTYNRPEKLREALESVANQTYPNLEIVVINDGGSDVSSVIQQFRDRRPIRCEMLSTNRGAGAARNVGISIAHGRYIAFLDDDDVYRQEHLFMLVAELESNPWAVAAYSDALQTTLDTTGEKPRITDRSVVFSSDFSASQFLVGNYIPILCLMLRKEALDLAGMFDESLPALEDWEWLIRLSRAGPFNHLPVVTAEYFILSGSASRNILSLVDIRRLYTEIYSRNNAFVTPEIFLEQCRFYSNITGQSLIDDAPNLSGRFIAGEKGQTRSSVMDWQVDVVIPVYNQSSLVKICVDSVLRTAPNAHIILVDDASSDNEITFLLSAYKQHPQITITSNRQNLGFIGATRQGAELGQAPFILFLNSDIEALEPGWLESMIPSEDDVAIVGAKLLFPPGVPGPLAGTIQHAGVARLENGTPFHPFLGQPPDHPQANVAREVNAVTGACFLIRRRVWDELGGWDERFGRGVYEDVDLCWQARQRGDRVLYQPAAVLLHWESASSEIDGSHNLHLHSRENVEKLKSKWSSLRSDEEIFFGKRDFQRFQKARACLRKAQKALERKNMPEVIAAVKRAVKIAPELPEVMIGYAQLLSVQGDHAAAAEAFEKALRSNPKNWGVWLRAIDEWQAAGSPERAAALLARLKAQFPNDPKVLEREAALAAWMPRPEPPAPAGQPAGHDPSLPAGPASVPAPPAEVFSMLLEADDLPAALQEHRDKLDAGLLELVRANAAAARSDGDLELAAGLEDLAEVIRDMLAAPPPQSQEDEAVRTLEMLLDVDDLPAALQQHQDRLTPGLLALVRKNAQAARSDGDEELAGGLDDLADYIEQALLARQALSSGDAIPAAAD